MAGFCILAFFFWGVYSLLSNRTCQVSNLAGSGQAGSNDGVAAVASFNDPSGIAVDGSGDVYIADSGNEKIRKIDSAGLVTTCEPSGPERIPVNGFINMDNPLPRDRNKVEVGPELKGKPYGIVVTPKGYLVVSMLLANQLAVITPHGDSSVHFTWSGTIAMGEGEMPRLDHFQPSGVAVDRSGNLYIADSLNDVIHVWDPARQMSILAGSLGVTGVTNGPVSYARFNHPQGVAVDRSGNVYIADSGNNLIREITHDGAVTTLAGSGSSGSSDGFGADSSFDDPGGIVVDSKGNIYVADKGNNKIRKITPDGQVTTLAGSGSPGSENGKGPSATFNGPSDVAVDGEGNVLVADSNNNLIRKITQF
jgi:streptogramin lyase